jgi:glycosyltransferase involved in cell wall biosynthesis
MHLSVVTPVYGCNSCLVELYLRLKTVLELISSDFEIIMVNDGSLDGAWETIVSLSGRDRSVKGVDLARNFGQHYAITAGLNYCSGDWVIVMDCDLQDKPEEIIKFYNKTKEGYDVVFGRRINRQDNFLKKFFSRIFYKLFDVLTDNLSDNTLANFGIYSKQVIHNYLRLTEKIRLFPLLVKWQGFKIGFIDIEHSKRVKGKSSYTYYKLFRLAINVIISQTNKPLKFSIKIGFLMSFFSMLYLIYLVIRRLLLDIPIGWTSIMVSIFFVGGIILANLGLLGIYIGKIFDEIKDRPIYIVRELVGDFKNKQDGEFYK